MPISSLPPAGICCLPDKYMWASVQTVRGCPKHCSFCSVWRTDGQRPRQRPFESVIEEIVELRRKGFRYIALADDNFYPVTLTDLRLAREQKNQTKLAELERIRSDKFAFMAELAKLPKNMVFFTQITMESAEDPEYLDAMRKANIKGALVGVEAVTPEGLKSVFKEFNKTGEGLVKQLQTFREHGLHMLGSFIFGLPSDKPDTFQATADLASRAGLAFAQFVMLTPFPGTVDFLRWEKEQEKAPVYVDGIPLTRFWLIPAASRPKMFMPHPLMSSQEISNRTQNVWDRFYSFSSIWKRSDCTPTLRSRVAFVFLSKLYRKMYAGTGISTDSARRRENRERCRIPKRSVLAQPVVASMVSIRVATPVLPSAVSKWRFFAISLLSALFGWNAWFRLNSAQSAIHDEINACNKTGLALCQKKRCRRNLLRPAHPAKRSRLNELRLSALSSLFFSPPPEDRRFGGSRAEKHSSGYLDPSGPIVQVRTKDRRVALVPLYALRPG